jgi:hypothetical protein
MFRMLRHLMILPILSLFRQDIGVQNYPDTTHFVYFSIPLNSIESIPNIRLGNKSFWFIKNENFTR